MSRITETTLRRVLKEETSDEFAVLDTKHNNLNNLLSNLQVVREEYDKIKYEIADGIYIAYCDNMYDEQIATSIANDTRVKFTIRKDVWLKNNQELLEDLFYEKSLDDAKYTPSVIAAWDKYKPLIDVFKAAIYNYYKYYYESFPEKVTERYRIRTPYENAHPNFNKFFDEAYKDYVKYNPDKTLPDKTLPYSALAAKTKTSSNENVKAIQRLLNVADDGDWGDLTDTAWGVWLDSNKSKMTFSDGKTIEDLKTNWKENSKWVIRINGDTIPAYKGTTTGMLSLINTVNAAQPAVNSESRWLRLAGLLKD